jgi:hypothetical protein
MAITGMPCDPLYKLRGLIFKAQQQVQSFVNCLNPALIASTDTSLIDLRDYLLKMYPQDPVVQTVTVTETVYVDRPVPGPTVYVDVPGPTVYVDKPIPYVQPDTVALITNGQVFSTTVISALGTPSVQKFTATVVAKVLTKLTFTL